MKLTVLHLCSNNGRISGYDIAGINQYIAADDMLTADWTDTTVVRPMPANEAPLDSSCRSSLFAPRTFCWASARAFGSRPF